MKKLILFFLVSFSLQSAYTKTLVIESNVGKSGVKHQHLKNILRVLCEKEQKNCADSFAEASLNGDFVTRFEQNINKYNVVNMSFSIQRMQYAIRSYRKDDPLNKVNLSLDKEFNKNESILKNIISSNPNKLFVTAAGNGKLITGIPTRGLALNIRDRIIPAQLNYSNLIKVTSLDMDQKNIDELNQFKIADKANFSVFQVDVVAPLMNDELGERMKGTSFAAPYVSKIADQLMLTYPDLEATQVREIIMKSVLIPNLDQALLLTLEYNDLKEESLLYKIHTATKLRVRRRLIREAGHVLLVKSGGLVDRKLVNLCALKYAAQENQRSISNACLDAHKAYYNRSETHLKKLSEFWQLRDLN